ncbi:MAG TPA: MFS transporter [Chitinophagaceae bacterium]|nr:MFS transporter [Chitinophagaceae bacterium]
MAEMLLSLEPSKKIYRFAVASLFFLQGLCFATWASRIPSIQQDLHLSEGTLGIILFALPAGSMIALPLSGWLVTRFGSKTVVINTLIVYALLLVGIGLARSTFQLIPVLVLFGMAGNTANIAMNTQAVGVEAKYRRNIMASFHGLWSLAGFTAAGIGAYMIGNGIIPFHHFIIIGAFIMLALAFIFQYLLPNEERSTVRNKLFVMPDKSLVTLGILAFCCMMCEGAMFDWSGIYFKKVVGAEKAWIGAGYTAFMCTMAAGRFIADWVAVQLGFTRTLQVSGILITAGLGIALLFPYLAPAITGFFLVGLGVSSVVPLVYSKAGRSKTLSPGIALAAVSSIGFLGFLIGPPVIGIVAGILNLRVSFVIIALMGLSVALLAGLLNKQNTHRSQ